MGARPVRLALCFVLGAAVGTGLDAIHAYSDVLEYSNETFGRLAWFVPLEFGLLGVGAGIALPWLEGLAGKPPLSSRDATVLGRLAVLAGELALFTGLYFLTTLPETELARISLAVALVALAVIRLLTSSVPGEGLFVGLAVVLGPATEAILSSLGVFEYTDEDFLGIPYWLPGLWANAGFLIRRLLRPLVVQDF